MVTQPTYNWEGDEENGSAVSEGFSIHLALNEDIVTKALVSALQFPTWIVTISLVAEDFPISFPESFGLLFWLLCT